MFFGGCARRSRAPPPSRARLLLLGSRERRATSDERRAASTRLAHSSPPARCVNRCVGGVGGCNVWCARVLIAFGERRRATMRGVSLRALIVGARLKARSARLKRGAQNSHSLAERARLRIFSRSQVANVDSIRRPQPPPTMPISLRRRQNFRYACRRR